MKKVSVKLIVLAAFVVAVSAFGQDWPQWMGESRDAKVTGFKAPQTWPKELTQKWKVTVGEGCSTPALVGDKLYVFVRQGGKEVTMCLNANTGDELWKDKYDAVVVEGGPSRGFTGPRSTPTVVDGKVITLGVGSILSCFDAATGKVLWRKDEFPGAWPQFYAAMSPIVVDGMCVAHLGKKDEGAVIAYNLADGTEKWKWSGDGPTYSSPVLMTVDGAQQLVVQTEKKLIGLNLADGTLLWQFETPNQQRYYSCPTPVVDGQTIYSTGQGTGTKAIKVSKDGDGYKIEELWNNNEVGTTFNTPMLKNGLLFGFSDKNVMFCINAKDGKTAWVDEANKRDRFGSVIDTGSVLIGLNPQSLLLVFEPDGSGYKELASYKVSDNQIHACPVVAGNRIYIKDQDSVILWTIE